jgi:hypothetical protein
MFESIRKRVTDQARDFSTGDDIIQRVIDGLANQELDRRADLIRRGVLVHGSIENALKKIRPVSTGFGGDMKPTPPVFTPDQFQRINTLRRCMTELDDAVTKATTEADYADLARVVDASEKALSKGAEPKDAT